LQYSVTIGGKRPFAVGARQYDIFEKAAIQHGNPVSGSPMTSLMKVFLVQVRVSTNVPEIADM